MKRKQVLGTIIPAFMMTAVITSGYAIWHYNDLLRSANQNLSTNVTQHVEVGTITTADDFKIVFDQTKAGRTSALESNSVSSDRISADINNFKADGIYLEWKQSDDSYSDKTDGITTKATYTSPVEDDVVDNSTDNYALSTYFDVVITFDTTTTISNENDNQLNGKSLFDIIDFTADKTKNANFEKVDGYTKGYVFRSTNANDAIFNKEFDFAKDSLSLTYKTGMEPSSTVAYNDFKGLIKDGAITVTYYAYVSNAGANY
jgi:hypothetical protein